MTQISGPAPKGVPLGDWPARAECAGTDPDALFESAAAQSEAVKAMCSRCAVRLECLIDALDNRTPYGVWGGMTERERRALLRSHPDVRSWRRFLEPLHNAYANSAQRGTPT